MARTTLVYDYAGPTEYDFANAPSFVAVKLNSRSEWDSSGRTLQGQTVTFTIVHHLIGTSQADFSARFMAMMNCLANPARRLYWGVVDGYETPTTFFDIGPAGSGAATFDRRYGPRPRVMSTNQITAGLSAEFTIEIECFVSLCYAPSDVEEFTWYQDFALDRNFNMTITYTGVYRVRSPLSAPASFCQDGIFWPPLPSGFYADEPARYSTSPDGCTITWTVIHKQVFRTLPQPFTDGDSTFVIEQRMGMLTKSLSCWFEAPSNVDPAIIIQFITALINSRFSLPGQGGLPTEMIRSIRFEKHDFKNRFDASVTSQTNAASVGSVAGSVNTQSIAALMGDIATVTPGEGDSWLPSNGSAYILNPLGTAGLFGAVSSPFAVCSGVQAVAPPGSNGSDDTAGPITAGAEQSSPSSYDGTPSPSPVLCPYVRFVERWRYLLDRHLCALPVTKAGIGAIVQQTANPTLTLVIAGTATRVGKPPERPQPPPFGGLSAQASVEGVTPASVVIGADGVSTEYTIDWHYTIIVPGATDLQLTGAPMAVITGNVGAATVHHPLNPMLPDPTITAAERVKAKIVPNDSDGTTYEDPAFAGVN